MGEGVPTIVSDVGWYAELPDDCVLKVGVGETMRAELGAALERLLRDPEQRVALGRRGRDHVAAQHPTRLRHVAIRQATESDGQGIDERAVAPSPRLVGVAESCHVDGAGTSTGDGRAAERHVRAQAEGAPKVAARSLADNAQGREGRAIRSAGAHQPIHHLVQRAVAAYGDDRRAPVPNRLNRATAAVMKTANRRR